MLITRQTENLVETQARRFEFAGEWRVTPRIQITGAYLFVNSAALSYTANPALVGNVLSQVPQNEFSFQVSYLGKDWTAGFQGRFGGQPSDNDQNLLLPGSAVTLDAGVSRSIDRHFTIFFAVQNLTNDRFYVSATPVFPEGPPISVRGGLRFAWRRWLARAELLLVCSVHQKNALHREGFLIR